MTQEPAFYGRQGLEPWEAEVALHFFDSCECQKVDLLFACAGQLSNGLDAVQVATVGALMLVSKR